MKKQTCGLLVLFLIFFLIDAQAQVIRDLKGKVIDERATPVAGASVRLLNTNKAALANAAGELSSAIPHGGLARATSGIARGLIRGGSRNREQFIYLPDSYPVFLASPAKQ